MATIYLVRYSTMGHVSGNLCTLYSSGIVLLTATMQASAAEKLDDLLGINVIKMLSFAEKEGGGSAGMSSENDKRKKRTPPAHSGVRS